MDIIKYNFCYISVNIIDHDQVGISTRLRLALPGPRWPPFENAGLIERGIVLGLSSTQLRKILALLGVHLGRHP